jgi:hypothetical protein
MTKVACTFRLDAELVKRLKDSAARSGGKISQAEIVESALADRFAVKDGAKLLAKVNQDQSTALTLVKEQTEALTKFQAEVGQVIVGYKKQVMTDVSRLEQTTTQELRSATASVRTVEHQVADMIGTLRQIEDSVQRHAQARLEAWQYLVLGIVLGFSLLGVASTVWWAMRYSGRF